MDYLAILTTRGGRMLKGKRERRARQAVRGRVEW